MANGKIKWFNAQKGYGFIATETGEEIFFHIREIIGLTEPDLQPGFAVAYDLGEGRKGVEARRVRAQGRSIPTTPAPVAQNAVTPRIDDHNEYRFLNPYNFVRALPTPRISDPDTQLLGKCAPPPHDRWVGYSGKITCELAAVSPLFVSDTPAIGCDPQEKDHKIFRFFRYDFGNGEELAIPATSLRGMVRSVFEAVTNSCFAHLHYKTRLSYHLPPQDALKLVPARVERSPRTGTWRLHLLTGDAQLSIGERPRGMLYAASVLQYDPIEEPRRGRRSQPTTAQRQANKVALGELKHKSECWAVLIKVQPPAWRVVALSANEQECAARLQQEKTRNPRNVYFERPVRGYLCINNQNIENKRYERFFFSLDQRPVYADLDETIRNQYADLIRDYQNRHREDIQRGKKSAQVQIIPKQVGNAIEKKKVTAVSRFVMPDYPTDLKEGDLVYAMLEGNAAHPMVQFIVPVAVPRVAFERMVHELLLPHQVKCNRFSELCPACRTFGWVYGRPGDEADQPARDATTAYASRVRFSHARKISGETFSEPISLAILGAPKPTTTLFYLGPHGNAPRANTDNFSAGYDNSENQLRGRKFYRHQGHDGDTTYWRDSNREYRARIEPSDQNRTVVDALQPGARFTFDVSFENLSAVELGALLWSLELETGMFHRVGYAKPLGFGSSQIRVSALDLLQPAARYMFTESRPIPIIDWKQRFKTAMQRAYVSQPFDQLAPVRDLHALLSTPPGLPIHYPRPTRVFDPDHPNYEWFMENNKPGKRVPLALPGDDRGLPLIRKATR